MTNGRFFERILAAVLLIFPVGQILAIIWIIVKMSAPTKPVFFQQKRVGKDGVVFLMWKIRTMTETTFNDEIRDRNDPRITSFGKVVRRCHIDELVQLINVMHGSMRFIGPRPELETVAQKKEAAVVGYHRRLRVEPGITGLYQIMGRCEAREQLIRDRLLIQKMPSTTFRVWILYRTALRVLGRKGC